MATKKTKSTEFAGEFKNGDLYEGLHKDKIDEKTFIELLTKLNYSADQVSQLLPKFQAGEVLAAQDQSSITS